MDDKESILESLKTFLVEEVKRQIEFAGHKMTGALLESVEGVVTSGIDTATIEVLLNNYGIALNDGVPPDRIPFTEPSGRGGRSKYIEGLQRFAILKLGASTKKEALGIAFAIARKQKERGMPISGPSKFLELTLSKAEDEIQRTLEVWTEAIFEERINNIIKTIAA